MDERVKKKVLQMFTYGLYVIGVRDNSTVHAFTGTWLSQASFRPPLVMLGVSGEGRSAQMIQESRVFSVSILGTGQKEIAQSFFKCPEPKNGKFGELSFQKGANGCPILTEAPAFLECNVVETVERGDHLVVIGEVVEAGVQKEVAPLALSETPWKYGG
ncbi:MAG: flavin reductase [Candidatus Omnitrophica bacterium]|nr:flavin reductase [Candidatus Omnitrophota bacterium]